MARKVSINTLMIYPRIEKQLMAFKLAMKWSLKKRVNFE